MPRNMSFAKTIQQFKNRTKTVTRRNGWDFLKPGDIVRGVEKGMGLKKGEKVRRLGLIRIISAEREPLQRMIDDPEYGKREAVSEGLPEWTGEQFVKFYCAFNKVTPDYAPNRIAFEYIDDSA